MKIVKDNKKHKIKHFYETVSYCENSFLKAYFQNKMGIGYVDSISKPKSVQVCVGDFSFVSGEPNLSLVKNIKLASKNRGSLIIAPSDDWRDLFIQYYGEDRIYSHYRQAFLSKTNFFDITKLRYYRSILPKGFYIKAIDEELYNKVLDSKWSEDFCMNFNDYKDFCENGIGFLVLTKDIVGNDLIAAGASSYIYFDGGIEIQIATQKLHRNQDLATVVGATLILECIERDIVPCWDSSNKLSSKLAKKLGYRPIEFYKAISVKI